MKWLGVLCWVGTSLRAVRMYGCGSQLSEMFQHLHDLDEGDVPPPDMHDRQFLPPTAAHQPSIGPSTHTNPLMTLEFQMKAVHEEKARDRHGVGMPSLQW